MLLPFLARERQRELMAEAERHQLLDHERTPVARVTLRWAAAADRDRLRRLAALDSSEPPAGAVLVAEVDGRLRAALPLDGSRPIADPVHQGADFLELLRIRADQLARF